MKRPPRTFLLVLIALALILIPSGTADSGNKVFTVAVTPNPASGGSSVEFRLVIANDLGSPNQLGSVNVTAPFSMTGPACSGITSNPCAPLPSGSSASSTLLQLRNLAINPGQSRTFTWVGTVPCSGSGQWSFAGKQSNNFSSQPGNSFVSPPNVTQTITPCKLAFANQPADTPVKFTVKDTKWGAVQNTGNPIKVIVLTGDGSTRVSGSGTVSIQGQGGTGCGSLTGNNSIGFTSDGGSNAAVFTSLTPTSVATGCTLTATSSAGFTSASSDVNNPFNVDPVKLFFVTQPTDTVVNTFIRDVKYGGTATPQPAGNPINVGVRVESQRDTSKLQFNGSGSVTIAISGTGCTLDSHNTTESFSNGIASFDSLKPTSVVMGVPPPCTLTATGSSPNPGYADPTSSAFNVVQFGTFCPDVNHCTISGSDGNPSGPINSSDTASGAQDLTLVYTSLNTNDIPPDASCRTQIIQLYTDSSGQMPTLAELFVDPVTQGSQGFNGTYSNTMVVTVPKHWVQVDPNNGNTFIDMCFGAQRISTSTGLPIPCDKLSNSDPQGVGWITRDGTPATCASDGNYWGFIGNKQNNIPASDPVVVSATSGANGSRILTISLGTVPAGQNWFWDFKWSP